MFISAKFLFIYQLLYIMILLLYILYSSPGGIPLYSEATIITNSHNMVPWNSSDGLPTVKIGTGLHSKKTATVGVDHWF